MSVLARVICGATVGVFLLAAGAYADESPAFEELLKEHSYSIKLVDGELSGPGADLTGRG